MLIFKSITWSNGSIWGHEESGQLSLGWHTSFGKQVVVTLRILKMKGEGVID